MSKERPFEDITPVPNIKVGYFEKRDYLKIIDEQAKQIDSFAYTIMALQSRIDRLEKNQRPQGEWIPVSERLPDIPKKCIVQLTDGHITIGSYHSIDKWTFQETSVRYAYPKESVIAWQPLPEPYKEAENE